MGLAGQEAVPVGKPRVSFKFEHAVKGVAVPRYTIEMNGDGTGSYHAEIPVSGSPDAQIVERPMVFTPGMVKNVMGAVGVLHSSKEPCASKMKGIADTGTKTVAYRDAAGEGGCTFNFSENKGAVRLTELFIGMEYTLQVGRALELKHRFDRLGLDAEMISLGESVESGRALELANIGAVLRSIAGDTELIERVRLRAAKLLERAQGGGESATR
jgi:hypothetical protein